MKNLFATLLFSALIIGCGGPTKKAVSDSDRRDAKLVLKDLDLAVRGVEYEQGHLSESKPHKDSARTLTSQADDIRIKYKGSSIEPQVSRLCLALTAYWELPDGKDPKAKAAAAEVEQSNAALQAVADGK